jgi:hypothetical protein
MVVMNGISFCGPYIYFIPDSKGNVKGYRAIGREELADDPDVIAPLKFLRQREAAYFQRFGETLELLPPPRKAHRPIDIRKGEGAFYNLKRFLNNQAIILLSGGYEL